MTDAPSDAKWQKLLALTMHKLKRDTVEITVEDMNRLSAANLSLICIAKDDTLKLRLLSRAEADRRTDALEKRKRKPH